MVTTEGGDLLQITRPLKRTDQKAQNAKRITDLTEFARKASPEEIAIALLKRERRTEIKERHERKNGKFGILNEYAYEEDLKNIFQVLIPSQESFKEKKEIFQKVNIIRFDMKMLNYFNSLTQGHSAGDAYKKSMADIIKGETIGMKEWIKAEGLDYNSYLVGGDEFAIITITDSEKVKRLADKIQFEIAKMPVPEDSLINGWVDYGIANLAENVDEFNRIESSYRFTDGLDGKRERLLKLQDGLADRRADLSKFLERINYLGKLLKDNPDLLDKIYSFATKGAIQISLTELETLMIDRTPEVAIKEWVKNILSQRDNSAKKRMVDPFQQESINFYSKMTENFLHV